MVKSADNTWRSILVGMLAGLASIIWQAIRLPVLGLLLILEPFVSMMLVASALFLTLTAFFWKIVTNRPDFPFFGTLALSLSCLLLLAVYHAGIHRNRSGITY
jgi:hypothetical protein